MKDSYKKIFKKPQLQYLSIKWKIFFFLVIFICFLLILLWLFQTVFLESFYKNITMQSIKDSGNTIAARIEGGTSQDDLATLVNSLSQQNNIYVKITDKYFNEIYSNMDFKDDLVDRMILSELMRFYVKAQNNNGTTFEIFDRTPQNNNPAGGNNPPPQKNDHIQSMVYAKIVSLQDSNQEYMVMTSAIITPINATVQTLRIQLFYITIILLLVAVGMAVVISRKISSPIIKINQAAKELAKGNYDTNFEGKGYLEISQLNDTLNYTAKELSKVEKLRRELIANISHDLRTPLTMITGYSEMICDLPGENTKENMSIIINESKRLSSLVNDVLNISQVQSGNIELHPISFDLKDSIFTILQRYAKLTEQDGYRINFTINGQDSVLYKKPIDVCADEIKISQVIYNLINNALTYTGKDKRITVDMSTDKNKVKVAIIDTGDGISQEELPYIWDRYYKGNHDHKRAAVGTGLGLSIVKSILEKHHATYGVDSQPGKGSTFWFCLEIIPPEKDIIDEMDDDKNTDQL